MLSQSRYHNLYVAYGNKRAPAHDLVVSAHAEVYIYPYPSLVGRIVQKSLYEKKCFVSHHRSDTDTTPTSHSQHHIPIITFTGYLRSDSNYQATYIKCPIRHKAKREAKKIKSNRKGENLAKAIEHQNDERERPEEISPDLDMENDEWVKSPTLLLSSIEDSKCVDSENQW